MSSYLEETKDEGKGITAMDSTDNIQKATLRFASMTCRRCLGAELPRRKHGLIFLRIHVNLMLVMAERTKMIIDPSTPRIQPRLPWKRSVAILSPKLQPET